MSFITVKAALITKMEGLTNFGLVDPNEGRQEGLPWEVQGASRRPLWTVKLTHSDPMLDKKSLSSCPWEHIFTIKGFFPYEFISNTEDEWMLYVNQLIEALKVKKALSVCSITFPPTLMKNEYVSYKSGRGGTVECHYAEVRFTCQEWITQS